MSGKVTWSGLIVSVQPRIRLTRSFDERQHSYLGYVLFLKGTVSGKERCLSIAVGKGAHAKHQFRAGDEVSGKAVPVADPKREAAEFYKANGMELGSRGPETGKGPPFVGVPPALETYRSRGHRRLSAKTHDLKCSPCIWACKMPVDMIVDHWNPSVRKHRFETFCYGPKSCPLYTAGPNRAVPGRKGMRYVEEDWVDEDAVSHRGPDD